GPEAGQHHHRQEEHRQEVGGRRGRPPARHVDEEELRQGAQDHPEPPVEPDPGLGWWMQPCREALFRHSARIDSTRNEGIASHYGQPWPRCGDQLYKGLPDRRGSRTSGMWLPPFFLSSLVAGEGP